MLAGQLSPYVDLQQVLALMVPKELMLPGAASTSSVRTVLILLLGLRTCKVLLGIFDKETVFC